VGPLAEEYNASRIERDRATQRRALADAAVERARARVDQHRDAVGLYAAEAYRTGGAGSTSLSVIMTSEDPAAALDRISTMSALERGRAAMLREVEAASQQLDGALAQAAQTADAAQKIADDMAAKKAAVEGLLDQAEAELARLTAEERARLEARQRAADQAVLAEAAAFATEQGGTDGAAAGPAATDRADRADRADRSGRSAPSRPNSNGGSSGKASAAVAAALTKIGSPYVWGAAGPNSFDCSGLIKWAYAQVGVSVPHYTGAIWNGFKRVDRSDLRPGDIVLFYPGVSHAGIYLGGGKMVHALRTGSNVRIDDVFKPGWWSYTGAVRIVG
jgi:cell wall-associated NlpC family hydrolase